MQLTLFNMDSIPVRPRSSRTFVQTVMAAIDDTCTCIQMTLFNLDEVQTSERPVAEELLLTNDPEYPMLKTMISKISAACSGDGRNLIIVFLKLCRRKTFPEISKEPALRGLDEDSIRHRFNRAVAHIFH